MKFSIDLQHATTLCGNVHFENSRRELSLGIEMEIVSLCKTFTCQV